MKRREFLTLPAAAIGGTLLYSLAGEPIRLQAQNGTVKKRRGSQGDHGRLCRIFPSDASGPGAREANVVIYIDRQLAGPYGRDKYRYTKGPWVESYPEHGYQDKANPSETYREGLKTLGDFGSLSPADQDNKLRSIEKSHFFQLLRQHTIEGMFCDPMHGGNAGLIGWQLVGYPGPQMSYRDEVDKHFGQPWRPKPASLEQTAGRRGKPWEDEKG